MAAPSTKQFILQGAPRAELARLCRQVCLAREQGKMSPVTAEDEFVLALTTVQATYGPASIGEDDLKDIVSTEESRVADAAVLAELISSRLAAVAPGLSADSPHPFPEKTTTEKFSAPALPAPFTSGGSNSPLSVADLIDGMLAQEKRDVRTTLNR